MPIRFHFHLVKGQQRVRDWIGVELPDDDVMAPAAMEAAKAIWPGIIHDEGWDGWSIEIADEDGRVLRVMAFV